MLLKEPITGKNNFWCFEESRRVYFHSTHFKLKQKSVHYNIRDKVMNGKIVILAPVCLGFWRG